MNPTSDHELQAALLNCAPDETIRLRSKLQFWRVLAIGLAIALLIVVSVMAEEPPKILFLVRTYLTTNMTPGWYGSSTPAPTPDTNGYLPAMFASNADFVPHPPIYRVVTNYVLGTFVGEFGGTNRVAELMVIQGL